VLTRATDADTATELTPGTFVFVEQGTAWADSGWVLTTDGTIVLGTTNLTFVQFSAAGQSIAGNGLTKSGNTIDAVGTTDRITVNADSIDIASTYVGQSSITTLGTMTSLLPTVVLGRQPLAEQEQILQIRLRASIRELRSLLALPLRPLAMVLIPVM
jgi:hypothetical protein